MKIAILGSTGFVGKILLKQALDKGYQVKTLVRNPEKLGLYRDKVEFIHGNLFDAAAIDETIEGTEAVLSTVAPSPKNPGSPEPYVKAMNDLVSSMKKYGIKRLIHIGGAVHEGGENENWTTGRKILRFFLKMVSNPILISKHLEWEVLKTSGLEWTLVRPPAIIKGKRSAKLILDEKNLHSLKVNVEDLADFMLEQILSKEWICKAPLISSDL